MIATKKLGKEKKKYMTFLDQALYITDWPPFFFFKLDVRVDSFWRWKIQLRYGATK